MSGSKATTEPVAWRVPFVTSIDFAPFTTWAAVSTKPGATTMPLPCACPVEHPVTVSPTTPDGGSPAQPARSAIVSTTEATRPQRAIVRGIDVNVLCSAVTNAVDHPLASVLRDAAQGAFPPVDGVAECLPPDAAGMRAVVSFTGHAYLLTELTSDALVDL